MQLLAQHKYGLRVAQEKVLIDLVNELGKAAVTVDLLEVKHSSPVGLSTIVGHSSSKGAAFILYNSARLETLFRTYNQKVESGYYEKLPEFNEESVCRLKEEVNFSFIVFKTKFLINFSYRKNGNYSFTAFLDSLL